MIGQPIKLDYDVESWSISTSGFSYFLCFRCTCTPRLKEPMSWTNFSRCYLAVKIHIYFFIYATEPIVNWYAMCNTLVILFSNRNVVKVSWFIRQSSAINVPQSDFDKRNSQNHGERIFGCLAIYIFFISLHLKIYVQCNHVVYPNRGCSLFLYKHCRFEINYELFERFVYGFTSTHKSWCFLQKSSLRNEILK